MVKSFQLEVVSAQEEIYSGPATKLFVTGVQGELEILANHAPLLTKLAPGPVWIAKEGAEEEALVINGGMLEVQPEVTIILADSAIRARDLDEAEAIKAQQSVAEGIAKRESDMNYEKAHAELAMAVAQLRVLKRLRKGVQ